MQGRRLEEISRAIGALEGWPLESFAFDLLRASRYPALSPTSRSNDGGEDARTLPWNAFEHGGLRCTLFASATATWTKLRADATECRKNETQIDLVVFATSKPVTTQKENRWRADLESEFGWRLEVYDIRNLASLAQGPEHQEFVSDQLGVPPPGGDYHQDIRRSFERATNGILSRRRGMLGERGLDIPRLEIETVERELQAGKAVLLKGAFGSGKSYILRHLAELAIERSQPVLLLDARDLAHIKDEAGLWSHLHLKGPIEDAARRISQQHAALILVDQLDSVANQPIARELVGLARRCSTSSCHVVVACRLHESEDADLRHELGAFLPIECGKLKEHDVRGVLDKLGIATRSSQLIELCGTVALLDALATLLMAQNTDAPMEIRDELDIWEALVRAVREHERTVSDRDFGLKTVAEATRLASNATGDPRREARLNPVPSLEQDRLISLGILERSTERCVRFRLEQFPSYLLARDAFQTQSSAAQVVTNIGDPHRARTALDFLVQLHRRDETEALGLLLEEIFDVR